MENKRRKLGAKLITKVEFPVVAWLVAVGIIFSLLSNGDFLTSYNLKVIIGQSSINGIMAMGLFLIVLVGGIDVSIGSSLALHAVLCGVLFDKRLPFFVILCIVLLIGCLLGLVIGLLVTGLKIPELIVTLAAQYIIRGIAIIFGQSNYGYLPDQLNILGRSAVLGIPVSTILFIIIAIILGILLQKTNFGKKVYAVGGNAQGAALVGINVPRVRIMLFMLEGMLVGFSGILYVATYGNVNVGWIGGDTVNFLLAAVLLGGVNMSGGRGTILGTCLGALLMTAIGNGIVLIRLDEYWVTAVTGVLILGALVIQFLQLLRIRASRSMRLEQKNE